MAMRKLCFIELYVLLQYVPEVNENDVIVWNKKKLWHHVQDDNDNTIRVWHET
jgi:hypothetical protein